MPTKQKPRDVVGVGAKDIPRRAPRYERFPGGHGNAQPANTSGHGNAQLSGTANRK